MPAASVARRTCRRTWSFATRTRARRSAAQRPTVHSTRAFISSTTSRLRKRDERGSASRGLQPVPVTALRRLREVLADAGYDEAGLEDTVLEAGRVTLAEGLAALPLGPDADE